LGYDFAKLLLLGIGFPGNLHVHTRLHLLLLAARLLPKVLLSKQGKNRARCEQELGRGEQRRDV